MVMGTIEHIMDTNEAYAIVNRLLDPLVSGSYLVLYDPTTDGVHGKAMFEACRRRRYLRPCPALHIGRQPSRKPRRSGEITGAQLFIGTASGRVTEPRARRAGRTPWLIPDFGRRRP